MDRLDNSQCQTPEIFQEGSNNSPAKFKWTEENIAVLKSLFAEGKSTRYIAMEIGAARPGYDGRNIDAGFE